MSAPTRSRPTVIATPAGVDRPVVDDRATGDRVRLSRMRLDRIAGLPADVLDLAGDVRQALDTQARAAEAVERTTEPLLAALFSVVPRLDRADRRVVLGLRRRVHAGRPLTDDQVTVLRRCGVPDRDLAPWLDAMAGRSAARADLEAAVPVAVAAAGRRLIAAMRAPALDHALPVLAPEFDRELRRCGGQLRPTDRVARTAVRYAVRAALKPSPLSHLTTVALHPVGSAPSRRVVVPVELAHRLFRSLAGTPRFVDAFDYRAAHRLVDAPGVRLVRRVPRPGPGPAWLQERVVDATVYAAEYQAAQEVAGVERGTRTVPADRIVRWLRMGLLDAVLPWSPGTPDPLGELARTLRRSAAPDAAETAAEITGLAAAVGGLADLDGSGRRAAMPALQVRADRLAARCRIEAPGGGVVHEDVAVTAPLGDLPGPVADDLRSLADTVRPFVFRSHRYDLLVEAFRERYGPGGRCSDASAFFLAAAADRPLLQRLRTARADDLAHDGPTGARTRLPVGRTSAPPALAVLYQLAAADPAALAAGDYALVVNQFGSALGGLLTRLAPVLSPGAVAAGLGGWLAELYPGCEVRTFTVSAETNNLQHSGAGVLPSLSWPVAARRRADREPSFADLALWHDPDRDTLEFRGSDGRPVAPVYTGIVPAQLCSGAEELALAVMDPWVDGTDLSRENHPFRRAARSVTGSGDHTPRHRRGRVVTARERWWLPADDVPQPAAGESVVDHLIRIDAWRRAGGLPAEVFFVATSDDPFDADRRKPLWLDFASPHSLSTALPLIRGARMVRFEEALPRRADAWLPPGPDGPRLCEHVSLLSWERPETGDGRHA